MSDEQAVAELDPQTEGAEGAEGEKKEKLEMDVRITDAGPCRKHLRISVSEKDIEKAFEKEFTDLVKDAPVPGFRAGKTPRKLIERKFRKDVAKQVKQNLLMRSMEQIAEETKVEPLAEPKLDLEAIDLPESGPFEFEFEVEVRPEFDLGEYKGLKLKRPVREVTDADVEAQIASFMRNYADDVHKDGPAAEGDILLAVVELAHNGETLNRFENLRLEVRKELVFRDGKVADFGAKVIGVKEGETREMEAVMSPLHPVRSLQNQVVKVTLKVNHVHSLVAPNLDDAFAKRTGFETVDEFKSIIRRNLRRRYDQEIRDTVKTAAMDSLVAKVGDVPEEMVGKYAERAFSRRVMELERAGFTEAEVRARVNLLRQESSAVAQRTLREQFVLQKVAELEKIEIDEAAIDTEVRAMAAESGETVRKVRARIDKAGMWEGIAMQALERMALDVILDSAEYEDTKLTESVAPNATAIDEEVVARPAEKSAEEKSAE